MQDSTAPTEWFMAILARTTSPHANDLATVTVLDESKDGFSLHGTRWPLICEVNRIYWSGFIFAQMEDPQGRKSPA